MLGQPKPIEWSLPTITKRTRRFEWKASTWLTSMVLRVRRAISLEFARRGSTRRGGCVSLWMNWFGSEDGSTYLWNGESSDSWKRLEGMNVCSEWMKNVQQLLDGWMDVCLDGWNVCYVDGERRKKRSRSFPLVGLGIHVCGCNTRGRLNLFTILGEDCNVSDWRGEGEGERVFLSTPLQARLDLGSVTRDSLHFKIAYFGGAVLRNTIVFGSGESEPNNASTEEHPLPLPLKSEAFQSSPKKGNRYSFSLVFHQSRLRTRSSKGKNLERFFPLSPSTHTT